MRFEFGKNWAEFSHRALTGDRAERARTDFAELFDGIELRGKTFLDVGFGQGLSLLAAAASGARAVGCDIDPLCVGVLRRNAPLFPEVSADDIPLVVGSILDAETRRQLRAAAVDDFDVVHAWGVLHHTGDLQRAIRVTAGLVTERGYLAVAIYNRHWSSPVWRSIKWLYGRLPPAGRRAMVAVFYPIIWLATLAVSGQSPQRKERGMDFYYDVVDWVGGYPYEYATAAEMRAVVESLGFECELCRPPRVPTGCNEFVFRKTA